MKDQIAKSVFWMVWSKGGVQAISLLSTLFIARLLTPSDYGLISLAAIWIFPITLIAEMGLGSAILQFRDISDKELNGCFWLMVPDVINSIWRGTSAWIGSVALERAISHSRLIEDSDYAFGNVINISKITLHLSVVEYLNRFSFYDRFCEYEQGHIGTAPGTVHGKETKPTARDAIQMRVAMGHQFIGLLRCGVKRYRMIDVILH